MLGLGKNTVEIIIAARDRTSAAFAKVNTQMKTMGGATGKLQSSMGGLSSKMSALATSMNPVAIAAGAAAIALATMGGAAINASLEFEKASATIRVGTGATGEALAGLKDSFKTVFTAVPTTAAAAATAIADLNTRLGLTGEPLGAMARQFLNLSRITGTDVAAAIKSTTRVMHDFAVSSEEQSGALDYLFKVSQSTGIGMTNLANNMTRYGGVMRQMGFDINTSAALLGKFEKEGVNLELVLSSLRMGLANFARAGEEPVEALKRVISEIQGMGSAADRNLKAIEIFGARSGPDMAAAIHEGRFSIEELMATLEASSETINKAAADTMTFGDKWTLLKNQMMGAIAPIGDVITNALGNAMDGLSNNLGVLKNVAGLTFDFIFLRVKILQAFLEGFAGPVIAALTPLKETFDSFKQKIKENSENLSLLRDIFTIITGVAKWLGEAIGTLVAMGLTPLVAKLKEGSDMLANFYDKLGPIKGALEWVGEGVHNVAESFRDTKPPIEEVEQALEKLAEEAPKAPKAVADAWALAIKSFQEGTGSYKEAIGGIEEMIAALTEEWMSASDERKAAIDKEVEVLKGELKPLEDIKKAAEEHFSAAAEGAESYLEALSELNKEVEALKVEWATASEERKKAIDKDVDALNKEIKVLEDLKNATDEHFSSAIKGFKGTSAEVLKNAAAYEKLQKSAQTLIDLDWAVFTEFEASLPNIEAGILDMESSFVGLKDILEENIGSLENVKESVMDIADIAAPFLEAGFLDGIKSIGSFAGSLKDAGSAINTFSSLQDVSIEGCINFSMHVHDMVSALEVLEGQMEDLVPSFKKMNLLIDDIKTGFLSGIDVTALYGEEWKQMQSWFSNTIIDVKLANETMAKTFGLTVEEIKILRAEGSLTTLAFMKQTSGLKAQTEQLKRITDALQPYLEFMRTLNELAALSTLSTEELNAGLHSIKDTLINLGTSLSTFDLRPVMESLFGTKTVAGEFTGGVAKGFTDTMQEYQGEFKRLIDHISRLSFAIDSLVSSFKALENVSESVLADETKLKDLFSEIVGIMDNFSKGMGEEGFAETIATAMEMMIKSASPLISYFQKNNAEVKLFNSTLTTFATTIKNVVDAMDMLKRMSKLVLPTVTELEAGFGKVAVATSRFTEAVSTSFADVKTEMVELDKEWAKHKEGMDTLLESFGAATNTITTLSQEIITLSASLKELKDMSVLSVRDIDEALKNIPVFLDRFVDALALNMGEIKRTLRDLDREWELHTDEMKASMPAYEDSTDKVGKLIGSLLSLSSTLKQLAEMGTISSKTFDIGFLSLMKSISNFAGSLSKNVDGLISSLHSLRMVWIDNEAVLFPLIRDFAIITDNLYGVAHNANRMADEFNDLRKNSIRLERGFSSLIRFIDKVVEGTKEFYTTEAAAELATYIEDVGKVITSFVNLERELKGAMNKIQNAIGSAVANIEGKLSILSNLVRSGYDSGANFLGAFIVGIYSMFGPLELALMRAAALVKAYLGVASPTKKGALMDLEKWPKNLVRSFSKGIEMEMGSIDRALSGMAAPAISAGGAGGNRNVTLNVTQYIADAPTADYANQSLARILSRHEVM